MARCVEGQARCNDSRECFAKNVEYSRGKRMCGCSILEPNRGTYPDGLCPFAKPEREITNGKFYPYVPRS